MDSETAHKQSTPTREKLLETAKQLFYANGYFSTTLAQISKASKINNGLITYYFGSKNNLASEIYTAFIINLRAEISRQLFLLKNDYPMELAMAMEMRFLQGLKLENKNFMRFYLEYSSDKVSFPKQNDKREHYYELTRQMVNPHLSDADLWLYEACGAPVMRSISAAYVSGFIPCDEDYLEDYTIRLLFHMLQLSPYRIEALVEESRFYRQKMKLKVGMDFALITT